MNDLKTELMGLGYNEDIKEKIRYEIDKFNY